MYGVANLHFEGKTESDIFIRFHSRVMLFFFILRACSHRNMYRTTDSSLKYWSNNSMVWSKHEWVAQFIACWLKPLSFLYMYATNWRFFFVFVNFLLHAARKRWMSTCDLFMSTSKIIIYSHVYHADTNFFFICKRQLVWYARCNICLNKIAT